MLGLEYFGWKELWSPVQLAFTVAVAVLYLAYTGPLRYRFADSAPVGWGKKTTFLCGLAVYYLANGGPLDLLGHLMFSAHMISMAFAYMVAPPLLLLGVPVWMIRPLWYNRITGPALRWLTRPIVTLLSFNTLFSFYHMPAIHDAIMLNYTIHTIYFLVLLLAALMMWWPIISPLPEENRLTELRKMALLFADGVLLTPACALIIFADVPLYAVYNDPVTWAKALGYCVPAGSQLILENFQGPQFFALLSPLEDQQLGGVIMKLIQELTYGAALAYIFFRWYSRERAKENEMEPDPVS